MAKELNKDAVYRAAKPKDKDYTINDGAGLAMLVKATGVKTWRFIYRYQGKQNRLSLGNYPATTLESARQSAGKARQQLADGVDPSAARKQAKIASATEADNAKRKADGLPILNSFEYVARDWLKSIEHKTRTTTHQKKTRRLEIHAFSQIGDNPIQGIKSPDIYAVLKPIIEKRELETAHRVHAEIRAVFLYAIAHELTDYDPAQAVGKQIPPIKVKHRAAVTEPKAIGQLLRDIYCYEGTFVVQMALRFSALVFQRPGEIRQMRWQDVDIVAKEWRYFVTKTEVMHIVPMSRQALEILEKLKPLTGSGEYVFPSRRGGGRPMSGDTVRVALRTLGYDSNVMSAHGFRSMASTLLNEQGFSPDAIERQLCHMPRDQVRSAYNRAQYLDERRLMMQKWGDYLDKLKAGAEILEFKKAG